MKHILMKRLKFGFKIFGTSGSTLTLSFSISLSLFVCLSLSLYLSISLSLSVWLSLSLYSTICFVSNKADCLIYIPPPFFKWKGNKFLILQGRCYIIFICNIIILRIYYIMAKNLKRIRQFSKSSILIKIRVSL